MDRCDGAWVCARTMKLGFRLKTNVCGTRGTRWTCSREIEMSVVVECVSGTADQVVKTKLVSEKSDHFTIDPAGAVYFVRIVLARWKAFDQAPPAPCVLRTPCE